MSAGAETEERHCGRVGEAISPKISVVLCDIFVGENDRKLPAPSNGGKVNDARLSLYSLAIALSIDLPSKRYPTD